MPKPSAETHQRQEPYEIQPMMDALTEASTLSQYQAEVKKQKDLKVLFINKEKERRRELDRVMRFADPETLRRAEMAAQVDGINKKIKKTELKKQYEELKVAFVATQEQLTAELQAEREKNKALQEELDSLRRTTACSHQDDILAAQNQVEVLKQQLQQEIDSHGARLHEDMELIQAMRAEQESLRQQLSEVQATHQAEVERLVAQLQVQAAHDLQLPAEREEPPQVELGSPSASPQLGSVSDALRLEEQKEEEDCLSGYVSDPDAFHGEDVPETPVETQKETQKPRLSGFKWLRHKLGLRKPKKWKRNSSS